MSLGQLLVSARKSAGMTIDQLSSATNIRVSLLKEFEENNFLHAGGDTYSRGHLRTIARVLKVDAEILLAQFDEEHAQAKRAIHEQLVENNATFAIAERKKLTNKQLVTYSVIGIFLLLATSVTVNSLRQSASSPKPKPSASASAKPSASAAPSATATTNSYSSGKGVSVKLEAPNGSSWLFVSDAAGITLYSGRASQGEVFEFSSTEAVNLRIGNAGAVKLTVNGKEVPPLGVDGEVVNVSYGVNS
jgi:cytoskeletal protein RodZ